MYPRLHLTIDNCFASKRWTDPIEWMTIARDAGVTCIEASADNECDPLYTPAERLMDWRREVQDASEKTGVRVANFYSGHGSYATLGMGHTDRRVRDHIQHNWLESMIESAASLNAGFGFYTHAFSQATLRDPQRYHETLTDLYRRLAELATVGQQAGLDSIGVEQMYSPHQIPFTIDGARALLREVYRQSGAPFYLTLDTGHASGQQFYQKPDREAVAAALRDDYTGRRTWIGPFRPSDFDGDVEAAMAAIEERPYLFARPEDGDIYAWLRELGPYSPILHLQQTDGNVSGHKPFTPELNDWGIIDPLRVFQTLKDGYDQATDDSLPPCTSDIYLTIEVFSGTAQHPMDSIEAVEVSAAYWRQYLPRDGMTLDELV